jgi:plastocyanin
MNNIQLITKAIFARRPLSMFSNIMMVALLIMAIFLTFLGVVVAHNVALLIMAVVIFLIAALVRSGLRWTPLVGSLLCSLFLYFFLFASAFPLSHLAHPRDTDDTWWMSYITFIVIIVLLWCMLMGIVAGIVAVVQNYRKDGSSRPRWASQALAGAVGVMIGAILLGAFAPTPVDSSATSTTNVNGGPAVHMTITRFAQPSVTIAKGSKLMLIDDGNFEHNLSNGSWVGGQPRSETTAGAPVVNSLEIKGKNVEIGPFTTAGTYHLYCSLHQGMNLTVIVQ